MSKTMRIAFPTTDKNTVDEHFGHCRYFAIYTVEDKDIVNTEFVNAPEHAPGVMPRFLGEQKATTIITGGMGAMAIRLFKEQDIDVILGANGTIESNLNEFLKGDLSSKGTPCDHNHEDGHDCH